MIQLPIVEDESAKIGWDNKGLFNLGSEWYEILRIDEKE